MRHSEGLDPPEPAESHQQRLSAPLARTLTDA